MHLKSLAIFEKTSISLEKSLFLEIIFKSLGFFEKASNHFKKASQKAL
jgi:hypothetical protein